MADLINRQDAINALERKKDKNAKGDIGGFYNKIIQNHIDALMQLPSAEPKIIKCKDCNHKNRYRFPPQYEERDYCEKHEKVVREDCYCSWAERKQDE